MPVSPPEGLFAPGRRGRGIGCPHSGAIFTRPPTPSGRSGALSRIGPAATTVGLPDSAVRESRERVRTAIRNAGFAFPVDRITVNLAPADIRKEGASFDLPIALGILAATGAVKNGAIGPFAVVGELALDGQIQPVRGTLAVGLACRRHGIGSLVVPVANAVEARAVDGDRKSTRLNSSHATLSRMPSSA